jgi:hypothetical protein
MTGRWRPLCRPCCGTDLAFRRRSLQGLGRGEFLGRFRVCRAIERGMLGFVVAA